jgi:predicted DNA-binding transcriptional regulator AlpA
VGNVPSQHLVGAHEIAERLGLSHAQSVHTLRRRHADFPEPVATLKTALIWDWRQVLTWAVRTGRTTAKK